MVDYGRIRSTVRPDEIVVDDYSVWVNTDVQEVTVTHEWDTHTEYEFHQVRYTKDEYMEKMMADGEENRRLMNTILGVTE